jgi:hypothetical protein
MPPQQNPPPPQHYQAVNFPFPQQMPQHPQMMYQSMVQNPYPHGQMPGQMQQMPQPMQGMQAMGMQGGQIVQPRIPDFLEMIRAEYSILMEEMFMLRAQRDGMEEKGTFCRRRLTTHEFGINTRKFKHYKLTFQIWTERMH